MPRRERPLEAGEGVLLQFAANLRALRRQAGNPTYRELARRAHYSAGTLSDAAAGRKLPSLSVTLGYVRACGGDVDAWERRWQELAAAEEVPPPSDDCPYVGLMPYQLNDAGRFFGRDRLVEDVSDRIATQRFVTVFGASGAGKSSLLLAGVLPRLEQRTVVFTPGAHPLEECAIHLAALTGTTAGRLLPELRADPHNLHRTIRQALVDAPDGADVVLVVDQFEEVFTRCADGERAMFIDALLHATSAANSRTRVVVAVRADFYPRCAEHAGLAAAVSRAQVLVGQMTANELREAITRPAITAECAVEGALVAELVADTHHQAGMLPLLSHVLRETWTRRRGNTMTLTGYHATGGIHEALARTAEELFATLDPDERANTRRLFVRLTALSEDGPDTRRRVAWDELDVDDKVIATFTDARLITVDDSGIEMTHEALIHRWPRLAGWLTDDRDRLHTQRQLAEDAAVWESLDRDPDTLYRGGRLAVAQDLPLGELTARERAFVEASASTERSRRHAARRRIRQLRWLSAGLTVALVATGVFAVLMTRGQRETEEQRRIAVSRQLATQAATAARTNPGEAIRLSLDAIDTAPTTEARSSVLNLLTNPISHGLVPDARNTALSADGQVLAVYEVDRISIWNVPRRIRTRTIDKPIAGVFDIAINSNGDRLATGTAPDNQLRVWDLTSADAPMAKDFDTIIRSLAFSPDGHRLAMLDNRRTMNILDAKTLQVVVTVVGGTENPDFVGSVVFSSDGSMVAASVDPTTVVVRDTNTGQAVTTLTNVHSDAPVGFSPDDRKIAAVDQQGNLVVHDLTTRAVTTLVPEVGRVSGLAYLPNGDLVFASADRGIQSWRPGRAQPLLLSTLIPRKLEAAGTTIVALDSPGALIWSADKFPRYVSQPSTLLGFDASGEVTTTNMTDGVALERLDRDDPLTLVPPGDRDDPPDAWFSHDYQLLALRRGRSTIDIYDVATGDRTATLDEPSQLDDSVTYVSFAQNNRYLTASYPASEDQGHVVTWDIDKQRVVTDVPTHASEIALAPDGRHLAVTTNAGDTSVKILEGRIKVAELRSNARRVTALSYQPDGRTLAVGHQNGTVELWNTTTNQRIAELQGHTAPVTDAQFSPDGTNLATQDDESTILLWNVADSGQLARIHDLPYAVMAMAWRQDSRILATALETGAVLTWPTDTGEAVELLCRTLLTDFANYAEPPPAICPQ